MENTKWINGYRLLTTTQEALDNFKGDYRIEVGTRSTKGLYVCVAGGPAVLCYEPIEHFEKNISLCSQFGRTHSDIIMHDVEYQAGL